MVNFNLFSSVLPFVQHQGYLVIFILMIIEGPIITTVAALSASLGYFSIMVIFILSLLGDIVGDLLHYGIGYALRKTALESIEKKIGIKSKTIANTEKNLHKHLGKTLAIIKFTPIFTTPGLLLAGALKVPIKKFIFYSIIITLPRTIFFAGLGYYFGAVAGKILNYANGWIYIIPIAIVFILLIYWIYRKLSGKVAKKLNAAEKRLNRVEKKLEN